MVTAMTLHSRQKQSHPTVERGGEATYGTRMPKANMTMHFFCSGSCSPWTSRRETAKRPTSVRTSNTVTTIQRGNWARSASRPAETRRGMGTY